MQGTKRIPNTLKHNKGTSFSEQKIKRLASKNQLLFYQYLLHITNKRLASKNYELDIILSIFASHLNCKTDPTMVGSDARRKLVHDMKTITLYNTGCLLLHYKPSLPIILMKSFTFLLLRKASNIHYKLSSPEGVTPTYSEPTSPQALLEHAAGFDISFGQQPSSL